MRNSSCQQKQSNAEHPISIQHPGLSAIAPLICMICMFWQSKSSLFYFLQYMGNTMCQLVIFSWNGIPSVPEPSNKMSSQKIKHGNSIQHHSTVLYQNVSLKAFRFKLSCVPDLGIRCGFGKAHLSGEPSLTSKTVSVSLPWTHPCPYTRDIYRYTLVPAAHIPPQDTRYYFTNQICHPH